MQFLKRRFTVAILFASGTLVPCASARQLSVVSIDPPRHALSAAPNASIVVNFDRAVSPASLPPNTGNFRVIGSASGPAAGTIFYENANQTIRFRPARPFFAGERVFVVVTDGVQAADATFMRPAGYLHQFWIDTLPAPLSFQLVDTINMRTSPGTSVRVYGGASSDLNNDDYIDIATINEDASDVRVLLNRAQADGQFYPFLTPTNPVGAVPSPNDSVDMNGDGQIDIVTCNANGGNVSVLFGNGDGTFQPRTDYAMGSGPHGLAIFDADGDGDMDVATANTSSNNCGIRLNNGNGTLGALVNFEGGGNGEYALGAGDMNNDGIFDLVVGAIGSQQVIVHLGNGNGTFAAQPAHGAGGQVWMLVLGDMNGDGNLDVTTANSFSNTGSILFGNGAGNLGAAQVSPAASDIVATDIGDIDGDGDLDWALSAFGGGVWLLYTNNGAGVMTQVHTFNAPANASCAAFIDIDNDRDLDLALFDEISDTVTVVRNGPEIYPNFCAGDGSASGDPCPCANPGETGHGCENSFTTGGALLNATGSAQIGADTIKLVSSNLTPASVALFFQGDAIQSGATPGTVGGVSGDGLACAGGALLRLGTRTGQNGMTTLGFGNPGDLAIHVLGNVPPAGATRYYQVSYRNVAPYCTPATFNESNGITITWTP